MKKAFGKAVSSEVLEKIQRVPADTGFAPARAGNPQRGSRFGLKFLQAGKALGATGLSAFLLLALLALAPGNRAEAQTTGSIVGTVRDTSGAVIPDASVRLTNVSTGVTETHATDSLGRYSFVALSPGSYTIRGSHSGFSPVVINNITLEVNQTARYDLKLPVGTTQQTVTVHSAGAVLQTETSDVGQVIDNTQVTHLPLNGRQFLQLASLTNGVQSQTARSATSQGGSNFSAGPQYTSAGGRVTQNSILVDGTEMRLDEEGGYAINPSVDSLREFQIEQLVPPAQYGNGTSIVTTVIKSGTDQFHGTAFEFLRNEALDARYINDTTGRKPEFRQNQFGANFGGPIYKNKAFFFVNYEGLRFHSNSTLQGNVPTPALLQGNISSLSGVIDPDTGRPFTNPQDISSRISPFAAAVIPYFPAPNSNLPGLNYVGLRTTSTNSDQGIAKIDYNPTSSDRLSGAIIIDKFSAASPGLLPFSGTVSTLNTVPLTSLRYTHVFTSNLLNVFHFGYFEAKSTWGPQGRISQNPVEVFGLKNLTPSPDDYTPPGVTISGYSFLGAQAWMPAGATDINRQWDDQVSYIHGRNNITAGVDLRLLRFNDLGYANQVGQYTFSSGQPFGSGNALVDFLLGIPSSVLASQHGANYSYNSNMQHGEYSFYGQDDIQLTHRLVLNAGLRYEYVQWPREVNNQFDNYIPSTNTFLFPGKQISDRLVPPERNAWGPRIGLAFRPNGTDNTVFRGGFGMMYGNFRGYEIVAMHANPPFVTQVSVSNSAVGGPGTFPNYQYTMSSFFDPFPPTLTPEQLNSINPAYLTNTRLPRQFQWNFGIQHQLGFNMVATIQYVGMKSDDQPMRFDGNPVRPTTGDDFSSSPVSRRLYPWATSGVLSFGFLDYSNYNALNLKLEKRYSSGLDLLATYTWSKDMGFNSGNNWSVEDPTDIRKDYGASGGDIGQIFTLAYIYDLPFGRGQHYLATANPILRGLSSGWHWSSIVNLMSGAPLSLNQGTTNGFAYSSPPTFLPNVSGNPNLPNKTRFHAFDTSVASPAPYGRYGNSRSNTIRGFPSYYFDTSLMRTIDLHERAHLQLRAEFFNVLNHPNYNGVSTNLTSSTFGQSTGATAQREIQVAAKFIF